MKELSDKQKKFLERRRKLVRYWSFLGLVLGVGFVGFIAWMLMRGSLLINPFEVMSKLEDGSLDKSTILIMTGMLPLMVIVSLFLMASIILFGYLTASNEKKYLEIIDGLNSIGENT